MIPIGIINNATTTSALREDSAFSWTTAQVGMLALLCSEGAFFRTLLIAYLTFRGEPMEGPTPRESLSLRLAFVNTAFLLTSSVTIMLAVKSQRRTESHAFTVWMLITAALAVSFLVCTAYEWYGLIARDGLTISRNLFGTTYFTLVGFHATHVTVGLVCMLVLVVRRLQSRMAIESEAPELVSWYWHLVDGVWLLILVIVYLMGH